MVFEEKRIKNIRKLLNIHKNYWNIIHDKETLNYKREKHLERKSLQNEFPLQEMWRMSESRFWISVKEVKIL